MGHPPFLCRHVLMACLVGLIKFHAGDILSRWGQGIRPPQNWQLRSLYGWIRVFHIKVNDDLSSKSLTQRDVYPFYTLVVLLPCSGSVHRCKGHPVCYPMVSMGWHLSLHQMHMILSTILSMKTSTSTTHGLGTSPIFSGHSGWHPQEKPLFLFMQPREVFLAWCWVITRPSSSRGIVLLLLPLGVGLTGVGLVHPSHTWWTPTCKGMPASGAMRRSPLWCRMHELPDWSFTSYEGTSVVIWHTTSWGLSFHQSLIFLFPWKASALTKMRSLGFNPMAPILQS